jgi:hypothetical protein
VGARRKAAAVLEGFIVAGKLVCVAPTAGERFKKGRQQRMEAMFAAPSLVPAYSAILLGLPVVPSTL